MVLCSLTLDLHLQSLASATFRLLLPFGEYSPLTRSLLLCSYCFVSLRAGVWAPAVCFTQVSPSLSPPRGSRCYRPSPMLLLSRTWALKGGVVPLCWDSPAESRSLGLPSKLGVDISSCPCGSAHITSSYTWIRYLPPCPCWIVPLTSPTAQDMHCYCISSYQSFQNLRGLSLGAT